MIDAVTIGITAFSTLVIAGLTNVLVRDNRLLSKAGTESKVVAYPTPELGG